MLLIVLSWQIVFSVSWEFFFSTQGTGRRKIAERFFVKGCCISRYQNLYKSFSPLSASFSPLHGLRSQSVCLSDGNNKPSASKEQMFCRVITSLSHAKCKPFADKVSYFLRRNRIFIHSSQHIPPPHCIFIHQEEALHPYFTLFEIRLCKPPGRFASKTTSKNPILLSMWKIAYGLKSAQRKVRRIFRGRDANVSNMPFPKIQSWINPSFVFNFKKR